MRSWVNLFDLDDTVINSKHRSKFHADGSLDVPHWNENSTFTNIQQDHLIFNMTSVLHYFLKRNDCWNVAITSRELTDLDYIFFKTHNIMFNDTLHRGSSYLGTEYKNRYKLPDHELKNVLLINYDLPADKKGFAFDDKQCNLDVFTQHGFTSYNANEINYNNIDYTNVITNATAQLN